MKIVRFEATPSTVKAGQSTTIVWEVQDADEVSITGIGKVDPRLADTEFRYGEFQELKAHLAQAGSVVVAQDVEGLGLSLHKRGKGYALHMVNYRLNSGTREIEKIPRASFDLGWKPKKATVHSFPASHAKARLEGNTLTVENLGIYTVVELG